MTAPTRRTLSALLLVAAAQAGVSSQERAAGPRAPDAQTRRAAMGQDEQRQLVQQNCVTCHNDNLKSGGLSLASFDPTRVVERASVTEKMIRKLRAGMMPPAAAPRRPDAATAQAFVTTLESEIDEAAA